MTASEKRWAIDCFCMIPHPTETKILMWCQNQQYTLPYLSIPDAKEFQGSRQIKQWVEKLVNGDVRYLYGAYSQDFDDQSRTEFISVFANQQADIGEGEWITPGQLNNLALNHLNHRTVLEAYFHEITTGLIPENRAPWGRISWYTEAERWIEEQLQQRRQQTVIHIELERSWDLSCVLQVQTDADETYYFKASPDFPTFVNEATCTEGLTQLYPGRIPAPLCTNAQEGWMLTAVFGEQIAQKGTFTERNTALWQAYAPLQVDSTQHIEQLLAIGCLDRRLHKLHAQLEPFFFSDAVAAVLEPTEIAELKRLLPRLKDQIDEVPGYNIPPALVHGDLHLGNVFEGEDGLLFFDWTDASITHPFIDQDRVYLETDEQTRLTLRDEYLSHWRDFESSSNLRQLWARMEPICHLHYAVGYEQIDAAMEGNEFAWVMPDRLRRVLKLMSQA